jgi:hypothetical protein
VQQLFFESLILGEYRRYGLCGYRATHEFCELAAVVDMCQLEADDQPEAEAGDGNERVTENVYHVLPSISGLPLKFIDKRDNGISVGTLLCKREKALRVMHHEELVPEDHTNREGKDPDTNVNQEIGEHISHSASH